MKHIFAFALLVLSVSAFACPGPDNIGLYQDPDDSDFRDSDLCMRTSFIFEEIELYLCITHPSGGA